VSHVSHKGLNHCGSRLTDGTRHGTSVFKPRVPWCPTCPVISISVVLGHVGTPACFVVSYTWCPVKSIDT